jgi:hypothetical protein
MQTPTRPFPPALPHGELREVLPDTFLVTGTVQLPGPMPVRFSRNMTVVRDGERLVLVNSVRLDEAGLAALDRLGKVTDVVRLAGFHGMDDPFYKERYGAKVWALRGQRYTSGFAPGGEPYFTPDVEMDAKTALPLEGARLYVIDATPVEGVLLVDRSGGIAITGDCLQHWHQPDAYFSWMARIMMRMMGFIRPYNVGPAWLKQARPPRAQLRGILDLPFASVLPSHGAPVVGDAREHYRPAIERVS